MFGLQSCRLSLTALDLNGKMQACPSVNFVGFQLVSPGLIVGSPCLWFGLLDEGSCGWNHGFELSVGYDI